MLCRHQRLEREKGEDWDTNRGHSGKPRYTFEFADVAHCRNNSRRNLRGKLKSSSKDDSNWSPEFNKFVALKDTSSTVIMMILKKGQRCVDDGPAYQPLGRRAGTSGVPGSSVLLHLPSNVYSL
jgi:hypothetical protein